MVGVAVGRRNRPQPEPTLVRFSEERFQLQLLLLMAHIVLAIFLILFGLNIIMPLGIPMAVMGALALIAGILLLIDRFGRSKP